MDWVFPGDIRGWLLEHEGRKLAELASGKRVLEIGSYCGLSTVCIAQTAESVVCIDPFDGSATDQPGETFTEFNKNVALYGLTDKVEPYHGTTGEVAPSLPSGSFDLVFIDGAHDFNSISLDVAAAERLLAPGGLMAFHDYRTMPGQFDGRDDPDVRDAVDTYVMAGAELLETVGSIAVVRPPRKLPNGAVRLLRKRDRTKPLVLLTMPSYDGWYCDGAGEAFHVTPTLGKCDIDRTRGQSSFLTKTFNDLWCSALNRRSLGVTHFAMIHADIAPITRGWVDVLMGELVRLDADMVSAVSPIKTPHGWTSTAVAIDDGDPWLRRRLTMKEVYDLPETFGSEDVGGPLLLNTALWVCRLDRPWCEQVCFDVFNRIVKENGVWRTEAISEDWLFSAALNRLGCKLYATRKVTLKHEGGGDYRTDRVWGTQEKDEVFFKIVNERIASHAAHQVHERVQGQGGGVVGGAAREEVAAGS